jgi:hypothetical protein
MNKSLHIVGKVLKAILRAIVLVSYYIIKVLHFTFRYLELGLFMACKKLGVITSRTESPSFERAFTDEEIEAMAQIPNIANMTLKEIQKRCKVSYRQARKIKEALALPITHYTDNPQYA